MRNKEPGARSSTVTCRIWIDLDNTPHVPFFKPIIKALNEQGYSVVLTARDAFQVCEMADQSKLVYTKVGRHYGKNRILKVWGLAWRSLQLLPYVLRHRPALGLSHGSRSQIFLCNLLRIPTVMVMDYEHVRTPPMVKPKWEIVPEVLINESLHCNSTARIRGYRGIKEDVYAQGLVPDSGLINQLGLDPDDIIVTVRPPASEAHYHNPESDGLFEHFMNRLCNTTGVSAVLLPRNKAQESNLKRRYPHWFSGSHIKIPTAAVNGLNLLWNSDFVVSGGGTMNREAAALGVPVYSIFRGKIGAVDRNLEREGRLVLITSLEEVQTRIAFRRREKTDQRDPQSTQALTDITHHIGKILRTEYPNQFRPVQTSSVLKAPFV